MLTCTRAVLATLVGTTLTACEPRTARPPLLPGEACLCDYDNLEEDAEQWLPDDSPSPKQGVEYVKLSEWRASQSVRELEARRARRRR